MRPEGSPGVTVGSGVRHHPRLVHEERPDPSTLRPGDPHYTAYVGPPGQYDFMGATQFSLLFALGLRARHRVLDFGCGSLRAGRLLLPYLDPGNYFAVEPNRWLIEEAICNEIGEDLIRLKRPTFDHNDRFEADRFGVEFDFIVAQSIFSHAGSDAIMRSLRSFKRALRPDGLIAATFLEGHSDHQGDAHWVYPGLAFYTRRTIRRLASEADLASIRIPWFHPSQTWYLLAADGERLPPKEMLRFLRGPATRPGAGHEQGSVRKYRERARRRRRPARDPSAVPVSDKRDAGGPGRARRRARWHRDAVGGLWNEMGELQFAFMKQQGLRPEHYLLDVGCGSLRGGVRFVDYLEPGRYFGLDISQELLDAGMAELEKRDLQRKRPQLRCSDSFEVDAFNQQFDFALAQSLFTHLSLNKIMVCLHEVAGVLRPGGRLYATFFENPEGTRHLGQPRRQAQISTKKGTRWITTFPNEDPYHYGLDAFEWLCESIPLDVEYVGDWGHPRNQKMVCFTRRPPSKGMARFLRGRRTGSATASSTAEAASPLVIGGTGGSGTRVVAEIVRRGGRYMGADRNAAEDAMPFARFDERWGLPYLQAGARREMERELEATVDEHLVRRPDVVAWGWKCPHSYLLLPFLHDTFPDLRFIHVIRDGRDIALSQNQRQAKHYGRLLHRPEEPLPVRSAAWWSWANLRASESEERLGDAYLRVRFEDLCAKPVEWTRRIVELSGGGDVERLAEAVRTEPAIGKWHGHDLSERIEEACRPALDEFGYAR
jgi:SAM-dependent methyltransferase